MWEEVRTSPERAASIIPCRGITVFRPRGPSLVMAYGEWGGGLLPACLFVVTIVGRGELV